MPVLDDEVEVLYAIEVRLEFLQVVRLPALVEPDRVGELTPMPLRRCRLLELEGVETLLLQDEGEMVGERPLQSLNLLPVDADDLLFQQIIIDLLRDGHGDLCIAELDGGGIADLDGGEETEDGEVPFLVPQGDPIIAELDQALCRQLIAIPTVVAVYLLDELRNREHDFPARLEREVPIGQDLVERLEVPCIEVRYLAVELSQELVADEDGQVVRHPLLILRDEGGVVMEVQGQVIRHPVALVELLGRVLQTIGDAEEWDRDCRRCRDMGLGLYMFQSLRDLPDDHQDVGPHRARALVLRLLPPVGIRMDEKVMVLRPFLQFTYVVLHERVDAVGRELALEPFLPGDLPELEVHLVESP